MRNVKEIIFYLEEEKEGGGGRVGERGGRGEGSKSRDQLPPSFGNKKMFLKPERYQPIKNC